MSNKPRVSRPPLDRAVSDLIAEYGSRKAIPTGAITTVANQTGFSDRHVRRVIAAACSPILPPAEIDEATISAVFTACGNLAKAYRLLVEQGHPVPSLRTFYRQATDQLGTAQLAYAKVGSDGLRNKTVHLSNDYPHRLHSVLLDHTELPIWTVPNGHAVAEKPWITVVMDGKSRFVLSWVLTFGTPSAEQVRAALIQSFIISTGPDDTTLVGGLPDRAVWDRGLDFLADIITESCLRLGVNPVALPGYSPHLKGRLERFWRFLKTDLLPPLPGYSEGPHDLRGFSAIATRAVSEDKLLLLLADWVDQYNWKHVITDEGQTPLQMWKSDGHPLVDVEIERLYQDFLKTKQNAKVSKKGIRFDRIDFVSAGLIGYVGRTVEVRHLPHDRSFIEVFDGGKHVCTAYPANMLTADQSEEFLEARRNEGRAARKRFSSANRMRRQAHASKKLEIGPDKTRHVVEDLTNIDLLSGGAEALANLITVGDDTDRLF